jgi:hypothetical protein
MPIIYVRKHEINIIPIIDILSIIRSSVIDMKFNGNHLESL